MIQFILNDNQIRTSLPSGTTLLDFIRYERHLFGTKIGCREGDCGACTVLVGELSGDKLFYKSVTSCLMPLGNAHGKHIVTVEGINFPGLNPVQQSMCDEGATQCGFCTPGFVMSLAGFCMQDRNSDIVASIDGNICRCTGYKSIERAAKKIKELLVDRKDEDPVKYASDKKIIPAYFTGIKKRLQTLNLIITTDNGIEDSGVFVGGGTDLYVQKHEEMVDEKINYLSGRQSMKSIRKEGGLCVLGASVTVTDLLESKLINEIFPSFLKYSKLVSSTPIRNMATIGGNFVNASPIGDFTVFFLALDTMITLNNGKKVRTIPLRNFYKGYKKLDKDKSEFIEEFSFKIPAKNFHFNFEKVSKRTNLDIASVNSAMHISLNGNSILSAGISAGGVGPIPMYLKEISNYLVGKNVTEDIINEACKIAGKEISPISDARGTATYKRFLLQQLIKGHFLTIFPELHPEKLYSSYEEY